MINTPAVQIRDRHPEGIGYGEEEMKSSTILVTDHVGRSISQSIG